MAWPRRSIASAAIAIGFALAYFAAWSLLASPFTPFPSDEIHIARAIDAMAQAPLLQSPFPDYNCPVYFLLALALMKLCGVLSAAACNGEWAVLHLAIASNAAIALLVGLAVFRLTQSLVAQTLTHAMYASAAWPVTYHFMPSYTVTAAALASLALYLAIPSGRVSTGRAVAAGVVTGLALWSSSSGPLTAGLLGVTAVLLHWQGSSGRELLSPSRYDARFVAVFAVSACLCAALFSYSLPQYLRHLSENVNDAHNAIAQRKLGYVPKPPFFTYLHVLAVYGYVFLAVSLGALAAVAVFARRASGSEDGTRAVRAAAVLAIFVVLHALLIDVLPSSKLARTHFPVYPVSMAIVGVAGFEAWRRSAGSARRSGLLVALLLAAFAAIAYDGIRQSAETRHVRTALIREVDASRGSFQWFVLQEDKHRMDMWLSLNWRLLDTSVSPQNPGVLQVAPKPGAEGRIVGVLEAAELQALVRQPGGKPFGLLLGPRGPGSGLSLAMDGTLEDFFPERLLDLGSLQARVREATVIPYYMHYPPFMMEEGVREALLFSGRIPNYRKPEMGVLAIRF
jgi:hypothetical protein